MLYIKDIGENNEGPPSQRNILSDCLCVCAHCSQKQLNRFGSAFLSYIVVNFTKHLMFCFISTADKSHISLENHNDNRHTRGRRRRQKLISRGKF